MTQRQRRCDFQPKVAATPLRWVGDMAYVHMPVQRHLREDQHLALITISEEGTFIPHLPSDDEELQSVPGMAAAFKRSGRFGVISPVLTLRRNLTVHH